jgi:phosphoserine aminotransferase
MEMSHRGREFISTCEQTAAEVRELLAVPPNVRILLMQGGGLDENAVANLSHRRRGAKGNFVISGVWLQKSRRKALRHCAVDIASGNEAPPGARRHGLLQHKGRKGVGGLRASICNAMQLHGVRSLATYMREFVARHG